MDPRYVGKANAPSPFVPAKAGTQSYRLRPLDARQKRVHARLQRAMRGNERRFGT
jgi:hypothetical protein